MKRNTPDDKSFTNEQRESIEEPNKKAVQPNGVDVGVYQTKRSLNEGEQIEGSHTPYDELNKMDVEIDEPNYSFFTNTQNDIEVPNIEMVINGKVKFDSEKNEGLEFVIKCENQNARTPDLLRKNKASPCDTILIIISATLLITCIAISVYYVLGIVNETTIVTIPHWAFYLVASAIPLFFLILLILSINRCRKDQGKKCCECQSRNRRTTVLVLEDKYIESQSSDSGDVENLASINQSNLGKPSKKDVILEIEVPEFEYQVETPHVEVNIQQKNIDELNVNSNVEDAEGDQTLELQANIEIHAE